MLVELSVMEQPYQAVLAVVQNGWKVVEVARRLGVSKPRRDKIRQIVAADGARPGRDPQRQPPDP